MTINYYCSVEGRSKGVLLCHSRVCLQVTLKEKDMSRKPLKVELGEWECVFTQTQLFQIKTDKLRNRSDLTWLDPPQWQSMLEC